MPWMSDGATGGPVGWPRSRPGATVGGMRTSLPFFALIGAFLVPDAANATRCALPVAERETVTLAVESVTVDGVPVTDLDPWRQQVRSLQGDEAGRVVAVGATSFEEFNRVP